MVLHVLCMNTNTNTFTYKARSDGENVSTVSWQPKYFLLSFCQLYSGKIWRFRFFQLDCLALIPGPSLPRLITSTQSPAAHSEETLSHPGLPHTDVIFSSTAAPDISAPRVRSRTLPRVPSCTLPPPTWPPGCPS